MKEWIFTFGFDHVNPLTGKSLANHFCRIYADSATAAREEMVRRWGRKWAFQYNSEEEAGVERWNLREVRAP